MYIFLRQAEAQNKWDLSLLSRLSLSPRISHTAAAAVWGMGWQDVHDGEGVNQLCSTGYCSMGGLLALVVVELAWDMEREDRHGNDSCKHLACWGLELAQCNLRDG